MAHVHTHSHDEDSSYFVEQICTIGVCGALGGVALMLYSGGLFFLHPAFHRPLLIAGIALLMLTAIRAVAVWFAVEPGAHAHTHDHAHAHDHAHDHDHAHCQDHGHDHEHGEAGHTHPLPVVHDHGHDHGWGPWRYAVLLLPIMLYFLNLPNAGFANLKIDDKASDVGEVSGVDDKGLAEGVGFKELELALGDPGMRDYYAGKTVSLKGQYVPSGAEDKFTLVRLKVNCCAADAIPLKAVIVVDRSADPKKVKLAGSELNMKWVEVKGQVQFRKLAGSNRDEWAAIILVRPTDKEGEQLDNLVKKIPPEERPFIF